MFRATLTLALALSAAPALAQARLESMLMSVAELAGVLKDSSTVVLHVAENESAFAEGHIPGARFVRYGDFAVEGLTTSVPNCHRPQRSRACSKLPVCRTVPASSSTRRVR